MLIDWFTVAAQVLNFAILAWLMKRFLYQPILDAIDARETRIRNELAAADATQIEAQRERNEFQQKNADFDQQRSALLQQASDDADVERSKLIDAAHEAADRLSAKRQALLASDARSLVQGLRKRAQNEVFAIARKALTELVDSSLEASACAAFIARLQQLEGAPRDALAAALIESKGDVVIRSAFELPGEQREAIHKAVIETFDADYDLRFETDGDLVAGIELVAKGQKFAWTISDFLSVLDSEVNVLLNSSARAPAAPPDIETAASHSPA